MILSIILAAGEGTRMKSNIPKGLHRIAGKPLLSHVIKAAEGAKTDKNVVVIGHGKELFETSIKGDNIDFVTQPIGEGIAYGTGFAVMQAKDYIQEDSYVIILYGDTPLITSDAINGLIDFHRTGDYVATVLTSDFEDPTGYGRIIRDSNQNVTAIVEHKDCNDFQLEINEINSGIYCFNGKFLKESLGKITSNNAQNEYYITDVIKILNDDGHEVGGYKIEDSSELYGVNSKVQLAEAEAIIRRRINEKLMLQGAIMIDPNNTYIGDEVAIGKDTVIYPGVVIEGATEIGENCVIGLNSRIISSKVGDAVEIQSSTIIDSKVGSNTTVGPYAYLRPNSNIGKNVKIGDFVEVKNSSIGDNSKASHLAYIGDADVGRNVNIGCGVVFVNYDGEKKYKTMVEDNAFIGSNSNLVAPVTVREGAYVAAGSTITDEVPTKALSIARARQVNKENWIDKKNSQKNHE